MNDMDVSSGLAYFLTPWISSLWLMLLIVVPIIFIFRSQYRTRKAAIETVRQKPRQRTIEVQTEGRNPSTSRQVPNRLTSSDIPKVLENVWEARQKWYSIGIQLKLKASDLDVIRQQGNNNGPDDFVIEMVKIWLRQEGATWEALIDALKHETVGYPILASTSLQL